MRQNEWLVFSNRHGVHTGDRDVSMMMGHVSNEKWIRENIFRKNRACPVIIEWNG